MINPATSKNGILKVIQITDTHLFADDALEIFGIKSNVTFKKIIAKLVNEDIHDTSVIFLTGDISQDESSDSYHKIADNLSQLNIPIYWIPGNHDNLVQLDLVFQHTKNFYRRPSLDLQYADII